MCVIPTPLAEKETAYPGLSFHSFSLSQAERSRGGDPVPLMQTRTTLAEGREADRKGLGLRGTARSSVAPQVGTAHLQVSLRVQSRMPVSGLQPCSVIESANPRNRAGRSLRALKPVLEFG